MTSSTTSQKVFETTCTAISNLYSKFFAHSVARVEQFLSPYIKEGSGFLKEINKRVDRIETYCLTDIENRWGKSAAEVASRILTVVKEVFPEIISFSLALVGCSLIPGLLAVGRLFSNFSKSIKEVLAGDAESAQAEGRKAIDLTKSHYVKGALLTSFIAGGASVAQGLLFHSSTQLVKGAFLLTLGCAGKDACMEVSSTAAELTKDSEPKNS